MTNKRNYKSSVFAMLLEDKKRALQLYNALNHSNYTDESLVEMTTLDGAIELSTNNDASFIFDASMNVYEHQSSVCPNMPLRNLFHIAFLMAEYVKGKNVYGYKLIKVPTPKFVVFYNGTYEQPEIQQMRLSDAFEKQTKEVDLELKCMVYNINQGKNKGLLSDCRWLQEYMYFVDRVREIQKENVERDLLGIIEEAIDDCIKQDILSDFLRSRRAEVVMWTKLDYTFERQLEMERESYREDLKEEVEKAKEKITAEVTAEVTAELTAEVTAEVTERNNRLNLILLDQNRIDDLRRASQDEEYQKQLMEELL